MSPVRPPTRLAPTEPTTQEVTNARTTAGPTHNPAEMAPTATPATDAPIRWRARTRAAYAAPSPSSVATGPTPRRSTADVRASAWAAGTIANAAHPPRLLRAATRARMEITSAHAP